MAAGGAGEMIEVYAKDTRQVILQLRREPPPGACEDVVEAQCKAPAKRWQWTFKAAGFQK